MSEFLKNLKPDDRLKFLEEILPMEMRLKNLAELAAKKREHGLSATLNETRVRLRIERYHLLDGFSTVASRLSNEALGYLEALSDDSLSRSKEKF